MPARRPRAASMSAIPGASIGWDSIAWAPIAGLDVEHRFDDLAYRRQGIELPAFDGVEEAPQLRVRAHRDLEVCLRAARGDREDLRREVAPSPLVEPPVTLEACPVLGKLLPQLRNVLGPECIREHDRR